MLRKSTSAYAASSKGIVSAIALALAAVGGAGAVNMAIAPQVAAQDFSDEFVEAFRSVEEITSSDATDYTAAIPLIAPLVATIVGERERFEAGNIILTVGQSPTNRTLQKQGLSLMIASGLTPPQLLGPYTYYLGNFHLQDGEIEAARQSLQASVDAGYVPAGSETDAMLDQRTQIVQSYFQMDDDTGAIAYINSLVAVAATNGTSVRETWLQYGLQAAYNIDMTEEALAFSTQLASLYPSAGNWNSTLRIQSALREFDSPLQVDLSRLQFLTRATQDRADYYTYIEALDPRLMSNEASIALERARMDGVYEASDEYYIAVNEVVQTRMASDREELPSLVADARAASGGIEPFEAAELALSMGDYPLAEEMYALALANGSIDRERDLMRLGIAQVHQGKLAQADANFAEISGLRAPIAAMWSAYIASQS